MALLGKYRLIRKLAVGGMAEVFLAKSEGPMGFEKLLVIKRIHPILAEDPKFVEMFLGEAKMAARLNHPAVVQVYDCGQDQDSYYLAMEYIDGPTLRLLIARSVETDYKMPFPIAAKLVTQACEGLHHAHEFRDPETSAWLGIVHRDVSPENILVSRFGAVKVVDFGIAKAMKANERTSSIRGKYAYMAPEQLRGKHFDRRVDIYALGIVLYELCTGKKPFDAVGEVATMHAILKEPIILPSKRRPDTPRELERIIERCLEKDPTYRYPNCQALQTDLEAFVLHSGVPVTPVHLSRLISQLGAIPRTQGGRAFPEEEQAEKGNGEGDPHVTRTSFTTWMADQPTEVGSYPRGPGAMPTKVGSPPGGPPVPAAMEITPGHEDTDPERPPVRRIRGTDPERTVHDAPRVMSYTRIVPRRPQPIRYALWKMADFFGFGRRR